jgi:chromosome segregation ATPase
LQTGDKKAMGVFTAKVAELRRVVSGTEEYRREQVNKLNYLKAALQKTGSIPLELSQQFASIEKRLDAAGTALNGDRTKSGREFETVPSINQRLGRITGALWSSTSADPAAYQDDYDLVEKKFRPVYQEVKSIGEEIKKLEAELDKLKAPYTPGRLPEFK